MFWGAIRRVKIVNNVRRAFVDYEIGYSDASQHPIYRVFLEIDGTKEVPFTDWERNAHYTNQVKNSLAQFLQSEANIYHLDLYSFRNIGGAIVSLSVIIFSILLLSASPYQVRIILNKTAHQALLIRNHFPWGTRQSSLVSDLPFLQLKKEWDSDNDTTYYAVFLATPGIGNQRYSLKFNSNRQKVEDYLRLDPDIQILKQFMRSEELLPQKDSQ